MNSERAAVLAPAGRDSVVASRLLSDAHHTAMVCDTVEAMLALMDEGAGTALVAEEVLHGAALKRLARWVSQQPAWSDFPFIVMTHRTMGAVNANLQNYQAALSNVVFIERPFHVVSLVNTVNNVVRGRRRQYQVRQLMEALAGEKQRTQEALLGERALSGLLMTSVPAGIVAYDTEKRVTIWNPVMARVFGISANNANGKLLAELIGDGDSEALNRRLEGAIEGRESDIEEVELQSQTSGSVVMESQHAPIRGGDGQVVGGAAFFRDTTERRRVEEQLRQAQKMETIGQLTGGIAHDFNNLLAAIQGNLDLLAKRLPADPQLRRYLNGAQQGAQRGASLTSRLLAFARRQDLKLEATDLGQLLGDMRQLIERSIGPLVRISVQIDPGLPPARVDANQLELAVLNLAVNARDAMPEGGDLTISLNRVELSSNRDFLRLRVADTGTGMDEQTLSTAIEPFFSTKELGKGTGLGLSMVHGLAVQLGGELQLTSALGVGTMADILLPISETEVEPIIEQPMQFAKARSSTILVVDDDPLINMSTVDMVGDLGHTVLEAYSGKEALEILESGRKIDAVVTDYAMPGMTGVELANRARELIPGLPILLATGYADLPSGTTTDLPRLAKPYRQSEMERQLSLLLANVGR